jgi:methionine aminopeptidase
MKIEVPNVTEYAQRQIIEKSRYAANVAKDYLYEISRIIQPGITEGEARQEAVEISKRMELQTYWHKPYIYFGSNTILTFRDIPTEEKTLQEEDIAYIDVGPVIDDVEGDAGMTLVFGNNPLFHDLKHQSERIFAMARQYWLDNQPTGIELYKYVYQLTEETGYVFNLDPAGHLIGSFPHKGWKNGLHTYPCPVEPGLWILEIQLRHPEIPYGSFYEEVLI